MVIIHNQNSQKGIAMKNVGRLTGSIYPLAVPKKKKRRRKKKKNPRDMSYLEKVATGRIIRSGCNDGRLRRSAF